MENSSPDVLSRLEEAVALRATWLEAIRIPLLKDMLGTYRSLFENVAGTLVKKGLLREDPYDYEGKVTAIAVPADSALSDSDNTAEVSRRIVAYRRQLDFLLDASQFTLASMDLSTLKRISSLLSYVDWESFGETSHSPTTRALARLVTKVRLSMDALSSRILHESQTQIEKLSRDIRERVAELEAWQRESWKAEVRAKVLPLVSPHRDRTGEERTAKTLAIPQPVTSKPDNVPQRRNEILEAVQSVCRAAEDIGYCEAILVENEHALENSRLSFLQRVRRWFQKSLGRLDDRFYDIEYRASPSADAKTESIDFLRFVSEMKELRAVLVEIMETGSPGNLRIEKMDEEQLCDFLDWQLRQLRQLHRRMEGLNTMFQVKAVHDRGGSARSIKLELLAIENGMNRADAVRRESIAFLEKKKPQKK